MCKVLPAGTDRLRPEGAQFSILAHFPPAFRSFLWILRPLRTALRFNLMSQSLLHSCAPEAVYGQEIDPDVGGRLRGRLRSDGAVPSAAYGRTHRACRL